MANIVQTATATGSFHSLLGAAREGGLDNGVIHVVDTVLVPPSFSSKAA